MPVLCQSPCPRTFTDMIRAGAYIRQGISQSELQDIGRCTETPEGPIVPEYNGRPGLSAGQGYAGSNNGRNSGLQSHYCDLKTGICGLERRQRSRAAGRSKQFRFGMLAAARHAPRCASQPALVVGSGTRSGERRNKMGHQPLDVALQHLGLTRVVMHADTETRHDLAPFQASPCQEF